MFKLLNDKDDFSLKKTIDYAINNHNKILWNRDIDLVKLEEFKSKILWIQKNEFESIRTLRNKHYAHTDKMRFKFSSNLTFTKCWEIIETIQHIFISLNIHLNGTQYIFSMFWDEPSEVFKLNRYRKVEQYLLNELRAKHDLGELQKIRNITQGKED